MAAPTQPEPIGGDDAAMASMSIRFDGTCSRRDALRSGTIAAGTLLALPVLDGPFFVALAEDDDKKDEGPQAVGKVGQFKSGSATMVLNSRAIVVRFKNRIWAMSSNCTHKRGLVDVHDEGPHKGKLMCLDHDSEFDPFGKPKSGPAKTQLDWLKVELRGDEVFVDVKTKVKAQSFVELPKTEKDDKADDAE